MVQLVVVHIVICLSLSLSFSLILCRVNTVRFPYHPLLPLLSSRPSRLSRPLTLSRLLLPSPSPIAFSPLVIRIAKLVERPSSLRVHARSRSRRHREMEFTCHAPPRRSSVVDFRVGFCYGVASEPSRSHPFDVSRAASAGAYLADATNSCFVRRPRRTRVSPCTKRRKKGEGEREREGRKARRETVTLSL